MTKSCKEQMIFLNIIFTKIWLNFIGFISRQAQCLKYKIKIP